MHLSSSPRKIIVFTHELYLCSLVVHDGQKAHCETRVIDSNGYGSSGDSPFYIQMTDLDSIPSQIVAVNPWIPAGPTGSTPNCPIFSFGNGAYPCPTSYIALRLGI